MEKVELPRASWDILLSLQYFGPKETILDSILEEIRTQVYSQEY